MSDAGRCHGLGPGRGWSSFDLSPAPQLRKVDLLHRVGAQCQRSTPAALQLADVDSSPPAAAGTSTTLIRAAASQLVDRVIASTPAELADGRSVHPPGMDTPARPVARPEHISAQCSRTAARNDLVFGSSGHARKSAVTMAREPMSIAARSLSKHDPLIALGGSVPGVGYQPEGWL